MSKRRLTEKQAQRISERQTETTAQTGLLITRFGKQALVEDAAGQVIPCKFRQHTGDLVAGDRVQWQPSESGAGVILSVEPRKNAITRVNLFGKTKTLAANIDQMLITIAPVPEPETLLIDSYLVAAQQNYIHPCLLLNKQDLLDQAQPLQQLYQSLGFTVILVDSLTEDGVAPLLPIITDQVSVLVGQSGVGKSSLINALFAEPIARVGKIAELTNLGRHTTSHTQWFHLPKGGAIIDSPGIREFRLGKIDRQLLDNSFPDIAELAKNCQFNNCSHRHEPNCAVQANLSENKVYPSRLASYHWLLENNVG